jgi:hypothetical protein
MVVLLLYFALDIREIEEGSETVERWGERESKNERTSGFLEIKGCIHEV